MAERQFRDGKRAIPDYMHDLMQGLETRKMTYEEALVEMNKHQLKRFLNGKVDRIVAEHFVEHNR